MNNFKENLSLVKAFAFDVDGVFTDGSVILQENGELTRNMNIKDGYAIQLAVKLGYPVAIITGAKSKAVETRFNLLGVQHIYISSEIKKIDFEDFKSKNKLQNDEILYMGDDIPDYEILQMVGFPTCPANAAYEIKNVSCYISDKNGGEGCVRDVIEQVLKVHNKWMGKHAFGW